MIWSFVAPWSLNLGSLVNNVPCSESICARESSDFAFYFVEPSFVVIKVLQRLVYSRVFDIPHDVLHVVKRAERDFSRSTARVTGLPDT